MDLLPPPFAFVVLLFAGWVNRQQQAVIDLCLANIAAAAKIVDLREAAGQTTRDRTGPE